jgi:hypothetical protein
MATDIAGYRSDWLCGVGRARANQRFGDVTLMWVGQFPVAASSARCTIPAFVEARSTECCASLDGSLTGWGRDEISRGMWPPLAFQLS